MRWNPKKDSQKPGRGHNPLSARQGGMTTVMANVNPNRYVLGWILKLEMVCWDLTISVNLFHSTGAAVTKKCLAITFFGMD